MVWIALLRLICALVIMGIVFRISLYLSQTNARGRAIHRIHDRMQETRLRFLQYERIDMFLSRYGVHYMFGWMEPLTYITIKLGLSLLCFFLGLRLWSVPAAVPLLLLGLILPDLLLVVSNKKDNEDMLDDIKKVYDTMRIQSRAGVFLNDTLAESYLIIKNRRLKAAVLELVNRIMARNDIEAAIDAFNVRFKCSYIDTLCIVIKQSLQSGKTVQLLTDISSQLTYIRHAISLREKERMERKIALLELLIYIAVLGIGIYVLSFEFNHILDL